MRIRGLQSAPDPRACTFCAREAIAGMLWGAETPTPPIPPADPNAWDTHTAGVLCDRHWKTRWAEWRAIVAAQSTRDACAA